MPVSFSDAEEVLRIIEEFPAAEIKFEYKDLKLYMRRVAGNNGAVAAATATPAPVALAAPPSPTSPATALTTSAPPVAEPAIEEGSIAVRSPMMGVFYRAPSPGAPPFVEVGQNIKAGSELCIIEVMKVMNTLKAPRAGVVTAICVENAGTIGKDAILMIIKP